MKHKDTSKQALAMLRVLARRNGITDVQLAERIGVRPQTIGQTTLGKFHPTLDRVFLVLDTINEISGKKYGLKDIDPNFVENAVNRH